MIHPGHRFASLYDGSSQQFSAATKPKHFGVYCDGPHCTSKGFCSWITGDRYKCAICADFDLCATCEASPLNKHNSTHPFIKFKSPVRSVTVQTLDAETSIRMGDKVTGDIRSVSSSVVANASTSVQTIAETKPTEEVADVHSAPQASENISAGKINETVPLVEQGQTEGDEKTIGESGYVDIESTPTVEQTEEEGQEEPKGEQNKVEQVEVEDTQQAGEQQEGELKGEEQKKEEEERKEQQTDEDQQVTEELKLEDDVTDLIKSHTSQMIFPTLDKESTAPSASGSSANIADVPVELTYEEVPTSTTNEDHGGDDVSDVYSVDELDDELENFISDDEDYEVWEASDNEEFGSSSNSSTA